jgi:sterol desaturase/sphingolipid hydroxylase (fatty acid hydroxylase superfamily)
MLRKWMGNRILDQSPIKKKQIKNEILWSAASGLIFAVFAIGMFWMWRNDYTRIYSDISEFSIAYLVSSIFLALFIQDTYYYWIHRWMHIPSVYRYFHKIHHISIHTSVWTSFSFHPLETFLQASILPIIIMLLPLHYGAILVILSIMTISATINHAGVEIYPKGKLGRWMSRYIIGATHHDVHHRKFLCNFGLYFTLWDIWMGTNTHSDDHKD